MHLWIPALTGKAAITFLVLTASSSVLSQQKSATEAAMERAWARAEAKAAAQKQAEKSENTTGDTSTSTANGSTSSSGLSRDWAVGAAKAAAKENNQGANTSDSARKPASKSKYKAVSKTNFSIEPSEANIDGASFYYAEASVAYPVDIYWGAQTDFLYGQLNADTGTADVFGVGQHYFWRDPEIGKVDFNVSYGSADDLDFCRAAVDVEYYIRKQTLSTSFGVQGCDLDSETFSSIQYTFYPIDGFALNAGGYQQGSDVIFAIGVAADTPIPGLQGFVSAAQGDDGFDSVSAGVRYSFAAPRAGESTSESTESNRSPRQSDRMDRTDSTLFTSFRSNERPIMRMMEEEQMQEMQADGQSGGTTDNTNPDTGGTGTDGGAETGGTDPGTGGTDPGTGGTDPGTGTGTDGGTGDGSVGGQVPEP